MTIHVYSFSYKRGLPPDLAGNGGGFVFDCRSMPNPYWKEDLRKYAGCEKPIIEFFDGYENEVDTFLSAAWTLIGQSIKAYANDGREHLYVAFGCTGGQHRSVFFAEKMAAYLRNLGTVDVELIHEAKKFWKR